MNKALISLFICFCLFSRTTFALQIIDNLVNQDKLTISLSVNESEQQIVGQALIVSVEVATDRWFQQEPVCKPLP